MTTPAALLTLDVSSKATGWAAWDEFAELLAFDVIRPGHGAKAVARIDEMVRHLRKLVIPRWAPGLVLMEWSGGKVHRRMRRSRDGKPVPPTGLSVLGAAQGAVRQALRDDLGPDRIRLVEENEWTGSVPKGLRADKVALEFPSYADFRRRGRDRGLDAADAIGIGLWYIAQLKARALEARAATNRRN